MQQSFALKQIFCNGIQEWLSTKNGILPYTSTSCRSSQPTFHYGWGETHEAPPLPKVLLTIDDTRGGKVIVIGVWPQIGCSVSCECSHTHAHIGSTRNPKTG